MEERYERNIPTLKESEQRLLAEKKVVILGCGGIGGHLVANLARIGIGQLTIIDGDVFQPSNLNRQLLATTETLGREKSRVAEEYAVKVNPDVRVHGLTVNLDEGNAAQLISQADIVIDALDNVSTRLVLEDACAEESIPLLHGAVHGWLAQIAVIPPGSRILHTLYGNSGEPVRISTFAPVPQMCAAIQTTQAVAYLCGRQVPLWGRVLLINTEDMSWNLLDTKMF